MTSRKSGFPTALLALLALVASLLLLAGCNTAEEESEFFNVRVDSTWVRYDSVTVVLADSAGKPLDTLFTGRLLSGDQLRKLDASAFDGGKANVILIGYLKDEVAKRETRPYDGRTGQAGEKIIVILIPLDPPVDTPALDIKPDAARLYTGGPELTLAPSGASGDVQDLEWSSGSPEVATVAGGKVRPVGPGKTWIHAVSGSRRDSSEVTVVTDAPVLDAGADTVVLAGAPITFRVKVTQEFGGIDMFRWSLDGDTLWDDSTSDLPDDAALLSAPAKTFSDTGAVVLRFQARDGEGNLAAATRKVTVARQAPRITSLLKDAEIPVGDSVSFSAKAEVDPGTLRKYTWDYGDGTSPAGGTLSTAQADIEGGHRFNRAGEFKVALTVEDDLGNGITSTVTVKVIAEDNADLQSLSASAGTLNPAFARNVTTYALDVANTVAGLTLTPTAASAKASIRVNGTVVASGSASGNLPLAVGPNTLTVEVTAESGAKKSYVVTATRAASSANTLQALTASAGTLSPAFHPDTTAYAVSTTQTSTTLTPTLPAGSGATLKVNGVTVASGSASAAISLPAGATTSVEVAVTAANGATRTYTVAFTVAAAGKPDLVLTAVTLVSKTPTRVNYTYTLENQGTAAIASLSDVSIQNFYSADTIFNNTGDQAAGGAILGIAKSLAPGEKHEGSFYSSGSVPAGMPYLTLKVDWGDTVKESDEGNNTAVRRVLVPPVADAGADTLVAAGTAVRLRGRATDPLGSVAKTEWKIGSAAFVVASPETTFTAPAVGGTAITCVFRVTDDDGLPHEDAMQVTVSASADADLQSLIPSTGTLSPTFARATTAYSLSVANTVTTMTLTPTAANAGATLRVNGSVVASGSASGSLALAVGENTLTVEVTAQSGLKKSYTVTVTRAGSAVNTLQALTATAGTLSPTFAAGTLAYTVNTTSTSTTVTPTVTAGSGATITVNGTAVASGSASGAIALAAGTTTTVQIVVRAQTGAVRTYSIGFIVPGSTAPDLVITAATITSVAATRIEYSYTIRNAGGTAIPDLYNVSIQNFYSANTVFNDAGDDAAGGSILGARRSLEPGQSYSGTYYASGAPPADAKYVTWKIDWGDDITESNENNNTTAMPIP